MGPGRGGNSRKADEEVWGDGEVDVGQMVGEVVVGQVVREQTVGLDSCSLLPPTPCHLFALTTCPPYCLPSTASASSSAQAPPTALCFFHPSVLPHSAASALPLSSSLPLTHAPSLGPALALSPMNLGAEQIYALSPRLQEGSLPKLEMV